MKIFILTKTNDCGGILFVKAYLTKKEAQNQMRKDYKKEKEKTKKCGSTITNEELTANDAWLEYDFRSFLWWQINKDEINTA